MLHSKLSALISSILTCAFILLSFGSAAASPDIDPGNPDIDQAFQVAKDFLKGELPDFFDDDDAGAGGGGEAPITEICAEACVDVTARAVARCKAKACTTCFGKIHCKVKRVVKRATRRFKTCYKSCVELRNPNCAGGDPDIDEELEGIGDFPDPDDIFAIALADPAPALNYYQLRTASDAVAADSNGFSDLVSVDRWALVNTNIGLENIFEFSNNGPTAASVSLVYRNNTQSITIPANSQVDLLANSFFNLEADSIDAVRILSDRLIRVGVIQYRPSTAGFSSGVDAALASDLGPALNGQSFAISNMSHPTTGRVYAWLSLVNLEQETLVFDVSYTTGDTVINKVVSVPSGDSRRVDIEAGHESLVANALALVKVTPRKSNSRYLGQIARYGINIINGEVDFAAVQPLRYGNSSAQFVSISDLGAKFNWVEIGNTGGVPSSYLVEAFGGPTGLKRYSGEIGIAADGQRHLPMHEYLQNENGYLVLTPIGDNAQAILNSMFYDFTDQGQLDVVYNTFGRSSVDNILTSVGNAFIGHQNEALVSNTSEEDAILNVSMENKQAVNLSILANSTLSLDLNQLFLLNDEYGAVTFRSSSPLLVEVLRKSTGNYVVPVAGVIPGSNSADHIADSSEYLDETQLQLIASTKVREILASAEDEFASRGVRLTDVPLGLSPRARTARAAADVIEGDPIEIVAPFACAYAYAYGYAYAYASCWAKACAWCIHPDGTKFNEVCDTDTDFDFDWDFAVDFAISCGRAPECPAEPVVGPVATD